MSVPAVVQPELPSTAPLRLSDNLFDATIATSSTKDTIIPYQEPTLPSIITGNDCSANPAAHDTSGPTKPGGGGGGHSPIRIQPSSRKSGSGSLADIHPASRGPSLLTDPSIGEDATAAGDKETPGNGNKGNVNVDADVDVDRVSVGGTCSASPHEIIKPPTSIDEEEEEDKLVVLPIMDVVQLLPHGKQQISSFLVAGPNASGAPPPQLLTRRQEPSQPEPQPQAQSHEEEEEQQQQQHNHSKKQSQSHSHSRQHRIRSENLHLHLHLHRHRQAGHGSADGSFSSSAAPTPAITMISTKPGDPSSLPVSSDPISSRLAQSRDRRTNQHLRNHRQRCSNPSAKQPPQPLPPTPQTANQTQRAMPSTTTTTTSTSTSTAPAFPSAPGSIAADAPILSFWGPEPVPLPARFARIKQALITGHEAELEACWARLIRALAAEVEQIGDLGAHLIPSIEFTDVGDGAQAARFGRDLRRYGVGVVRKVVPREEADGMMRDTVRYLEERFRGDAAADNNKGSATEKKSSSKSSCARNGTCAPRDAYQIKPLAQDPTCYDFFWTPAQVRSRAHPNVLSTQRFMMGLWGSAPDDRIATRLPISYADRIRIHGWKGAEQQGRAAADAAAKTKKNGQTHTNGHSSNGSTSLQPPQPDHQPQSPDDWITALQSSAGIIAQVDNGSLERWEPDGYQRGSGTQLAPGSGSGSGSTSGKAQSKSTAISGTYDHVFHGRWEDYDPWECASRVPATMDLYNGYGACTIFRMFQGVLALSTIEPGMIRLLPSPKLATSYYLLRPFFSAIRPAPEVRSGPEWDAYLDPSNWRLEREPDTIIHGAVPGHAQRITERWHPHLCLRSSMITLPTLQPGDYIFWHPDLPYHISSNNPGLKTPSTNACSSSMATTSSTHNTNSSSSNQTSNCNNGSSGGGDCTSEDVSMLVYIPAAPLTQTNALYLARQRKAFLKGLPNPDFDSCGRGQAVEDPAARAGEEEIEQVGGTEGLQAMGLALWGTEQSEQQPVADQKREKILGGASGMNMRRGRREDETGGKRKRGEDDDMEMDGTRLEHHTRGSGKGYGSSNGNGSASPSTSSAESEIVRLSNLILFPDKSMLGYSV